VILANRCIHRTSRNAPNGKSSRKVDLAAAVVRRASRDPEGAAWERGGSERNSPGVQRPETAVPRKKGKPARRFASIRLRTSRIGRNPIH